MKNFFIETIKTAFALAVVMTAVTPFFIAFAYVVCR